MATPHVVGAAAKVLQSNPSATPAQVAAALASASTKGVVTDARSPHPDLLFSN
jgi:subtilisin family serine protease